MASGEISFFLLLAFVLSLPSQGAGAERDALLSFLSNLSTTSQTALPSWGANSSVHDCCLWEGITCDSGGHVVNLSLPSKGLVGTISPSLKDLPRLGQLNLSHNSLSGAVDPTLLTSPSLVAVDLSFNSLSGQLPRLQTQGSLPRLQILDLSSNRFNGSFPPVWDAAPEIKAVNGSNNSFSGNIPNGICVLSRGLELLDLSMNELSGRIPRDLGSCSRLRVLRLGFNRHTGEIPSELYDAVSLQQLSLPDNHLHGKLHGVEKLRDLTVLDLGRNDLGGELPDSIGKLTKLEHLLLNCNKLVGSLPPSLQNCTRLRCLNLRGNNFNGEISAVDFSSLLDLQTLDLGNNNFTGGLPASIYSCSSLTALRLAKNSLMGQIAPEILKLRSLSFLSLSGNNFSNITGAFRILGGCENLAAIVLSKNFIGESMPEQILVQGGFANLRVLALANCQLKGQVPPWLSKLHKLQVLDLSLNQLTGPLPGGLLGGLQHLFYLDLSHNQFDSGEIPAELMRMRMLSSKQASTGVNWSFLPLPVFYSKVNASASLQYNQLSSLPAAIYLRDCNLEREIPPEIGQLEMLQALDLSQNNLSGPIPPQIGNLTNLQDLMLSENHLSGIIPPELAGLSFLSRFNVSFNNLFGQIPKGGQLDSFPNSSFVGNPGLCGLPIVATCKSETSMVGTKKGKHVNKKLIIGVIFAICFGGALAFTLLVFFMLSKKRKRLPEGDASEKEDTGIITDDSTHVAPHDEMNSSVMLFPGNSDVKSLRVAHILKATDNFNQDSIIGCGGFGLVYKAVLPDGSKLAIKRLSGETGIMEREFKAEVEALSNAKHKNLVTLQGYCIYGSFRLLIYSFMENGSLDYWLHERINGAAILTWPMRLQIARGASTGLSYIHQICKPHIVHRDIKSSNILLDHEFQAHVADFGLSRLILPTNTHVSTELVGTLGYIPPEYGQGWIATLRGDIYSFGVVLLELLTGRRPFEVFKPKQSRELVGWVQQVRIQGGQEEIFEPLLRHDESMEQMLQVLDLACLCVDSNPLKRPTIREIVDWLDNVGDDQQKQK